MKVKCETIVILAIMLMASAVAYWGGYMQGRMEGEVIGRVDARTAICSCGNKVIAEGHYPIGTYGECTKCGKAW